MNHNILSEIIVDGLPKSYVDALAKDYLYQVCKVILLSSNLSNDYIFELDNSLDVKEIEKHIVKLTQDLETQNETDNHKDVIIL
jgi:hypothetical protein